MKVGLRSIGKRFRTAGGAVDAVRDVTLEIADGELFVLLGPSGCGKSTLLELCAGLQSPSAGEIWFGDRVVAAPARKIFVLPRQRDVAMVLQSYALYPHMTVRENIAFPLRIARQPRAARERAVQESAALLGIADLLGRKPAELSGGQRQRVAIARALVRRPSLFLLDEPFSNLDARLRTGTRAELARLQRQLGVTTLHVTHDQTEAMTLGDRIALLRDGRVVQVGTPDELYDRPQSAFVATFLGAPPMNLIPVQLDRSGATPVAQLGELAISLPRPDRIHPGHSGPALLGLRPERLCLEPEEGAAAGSSPGFALAGQVTAVESLGRERLCHVALHQRPGHSVQVLTEDRSIGPGRAIRLRLDPADAHVFCTGDAV